MTEEDLATAIREAPGPLRVIGGGTRSRPGDGTVLSTSALAGIVTYEPGALTLIARTGTPMDQIEAALAAEGQALAFEPMDHRAVLGTNGVPTIGGVVAANVSGPRRILAGACRDHLLGVRFVDGQGRILKNGGRVMKNVTGLDLGKLICGSHGTLGVLTEVALKTLPCAERAETLAFDVTEAQAVELFCAALGTPFEVSGAAFSRGTAWLRIEGLSAQVAYRREKLAALLPHPFEVLDADATRDLWRGIRDVAQFAGSALPLWRVLVKPTDAPRIASALRALGGETMLDWAGGLIWYQGAGDVRAVASHSTLIRGDIAPAFAPEPPAVAQIAQGLRRQFDPRGILNPGLMGA